MELKKLAIKNLIKTSFEQTKKKFWQYFWANLILGVILLAITAVGFIISIILISSASSTKQPAIIVPVVIFTFVIFSIPIMYLTSLMKLTSAVIIISKEKIKLRETVDKLKPFVWRYAFTDLFIYLFLLGLLPFGVVSLFIIPFLWGMWNSFVIFIFLEKGKMGLINLWESKAVFHKRSWFIIKRIIITELIFIAVTLVFQITQRIFLIPFNHNKPAIYIFGVIFFVIYFFINSIRPVFTTYYNFTIYKNLEKTTQVRSEKIWKIISGIGYVVIILFIIFAVPFLYNLTNSNKNFTPRPKRIQGIMNNKLLMHSQY